jgi:AraC family transcriptional regulator
MSGNHHNEANSSTQTDSGINTQSLIEHLLQFRSLKAAAKADARSAVSLLRAVKKASGETPGRLLREQRLAQAARLVAFDEARLIDIAMECGYGSHEAFTRAFMRRFGIAPAVLRLRIREAFNAIATQDTVVCSAKHQEAIKGLHVPYTGNYQDIAEAIRSFVRDAFQAGFLNGIPVDPIVIYESHPWIDEAIKLKAKIVIADSYLNSAAPAARLQVPEGLFYCFAHRGAYEHVITAYNRMIGRLLLRGKPDFRLETAVIMFKNNHNAQSVADYETEIRVRKAA